MKTVQLKNGIQIPSIGLGTWKISDRQEMLATIDNAYAYGYRLFDTAAAYGNEIALGKAIRELGIPREELMIQDKLWNTCFGYIEAQEACKRSLRKLKVDYLDVYLIHWPAVMRTHGDRWQIINEETWRGFEKLYKEGYVKAIGVCNFRPHHLEELSRTAESMPHINQIEFHPGMMQEETVSYCREREIQIEASSPLGNGRILSNDILRKLAEKKGISTAGLCLKWALKHNVVIIPKTTKAARLKENIQLDDFDLSEQEMAAIDGLSFCGGLNIDPDKEIDFNEL